MPTSKLAKRGWTILFLAIGAFYLYGLGAFPLVGPDEPRYAEVAREMFVRGDFITPTLGGLPWFEKPSLLYWLMMASYRVFGVSEYAARFGPAVCGLMTAALVWWAARSVAESPEEAEAQSSGIANWSALVLLSSLGAIGFSRGASFDIVLTMTLTGALSCFIVWHRRSTEEPRASVKLLIGFYLFIGLSLLAKGLVGVILPFGVLALFFLLRREWPPRAFIKSLAWGIPLSLACAALWYGPMIYRHGWVFVDQFLIQHHFARFLSNKYRHPQPFYFYLPVLALLILPWTVVFIAALVSSRRMSWRAVISADSLRVFAIAWVAVPLIFFSFSGSKIPGYILPVLPAASLLVGERISCFLRMNRGDRVIRLTGALIAMVAIFAAWYSVRKLSVAVSWAVAGSFLVLVPAVIALIAPKKRAILFLLFALTPFAVAVIALRPAAAIAEGESVRSLIRAADARGHSSAPVFFMLSDDRTAEFYAGGRLVYQPSGEPFRFDGAHELAAALRERGGRAR